MYTGRRPLYIGIQMKRKGITKTFMMIGLYTNISALQGVQPALLCLPGGFPEQSRTRSSSPQVLSASALAHLSELIDFGIELLPQRENGLPWIFC